MTVHIAYVILGALWMACMTAIICTHWLCSTIKGFGFYKSGDCCVFKWKAQRGEIPEVQRVSIMRKGNQETMSSVKEK